MASTAESSAHAGGRQGTIQISVVQGDAFVWSAAWIAQLRREHGIVGMLTGSLPLIPQQNVFLGVPLQLFEEEVAYLVRKRAAVLVDDVAVHADMESHLSPDELRRWHEGRRKAIAESKEAIVEQSRQTKARWEQHAASKGRAVERRREREQRRQQEKREQEDGEEEGYVFASSSTEDDKKAEQDADEERRNMSHPVTIPTTSFEHPWRHVKVGENAFDTLSSAAKAGLWHYPRTADERAKCAAFEDMRNRGYFMGKGLRFGGDFVVYPGDPLRYHSHFTATIQTTPQTLISAQELVSAGRLGTAVKKAHLLCSVTDEQCKEQSDEECWQDRLAGGDDDAAKRRWGQVDYYSLTWAGFGT